MAPKRKNEALVEEDTAKKQRMTDEDSPGPSTRPSPMPSATTAVDPVRSAPTCTSQMKERKGKNKVDTHRQEESSGSQPTSSSKKAKPGDINRKRIRKLTPARPWPVVPTSVSATGPRSAHKEGKNYICLTRKTGLGSYMRRCKDVIIKDGYVFLYVTTE